HDGSTAPAQLVRAEVALPTRHPRQAVGIAWIEAVADVEVAGHVARRAGQAAEHDRHGGDGRVRPARDAPGRALQTDQAVETGGNADRPSTVATRAEGEQAAGDGRRATGR